MYGYCVEQAQLLDRRIVSLKAPPKASDVVRMLQEMRAVQAVFASSSRNS